MLLVNYAHRLPSGHDMAAVRLRAADRGQLWDDRPDLYFKAFLMREAGKDGAIANSYSSLYLWNSSDAFSKFLAGGSYKIVTDSFGRAAIHSHVVLDAKKGAAHSANTAFIENVSISPDEDLTEKFADEIKINNEIASNPKVAASAIAVDAANWRFIRVVLCEEKYSGSGVQFEILHLARPLLDSLPASG